MCENYAKLPCHTIPHHAMPIHTIPHHAMPYHRMPSQAIPCHAIPSHAMPYHLMPCHRVKGNITNKNVQGNRWVCYSTISFVLTYPVLKMNGIRNRKKGISQKENEEDTFLSHLNTMLSSTLYYKHGNITNSTK